MDREVSHYVVTAHPPGGVLFSIKCNFLSPDSEDIVVAKSRRLEIRQLRTSEDPEEDAAAPSPFPIVWSVPINGRITSLVPIHIRTCSTCLLFLTTDQHQYAVVGYAPDAVPYPVMTHASGSLQGDEWNILGREAECGPLVAVDPHNRCIVLHLYDGLITVFPIHQSYVPSTKQTTQRIKGASSSSAPVGGFASASHSGSASASASASIASSSSSIPSSLLRSSSILGPAFHARMEERTVLNLTMLHHMDASKTPPHVCLLHQDSRGAQHITTHAIDLHKQQVWFLTQSVGGSASGGAGAAPSSCEWLKKSRIDGGSSLLIPVPPRPTRAASAAAASATTAGTVSSASSVATTATAHTTNVTIGGGGGASSNAASSGGVVILGQRQITYCALNSYKVMPIPPALLLSWTTVPPDVSGMPRYLIADEFGNLHMLTLITSDIRVVALQLDTLGSCTLSSQLVYLDHGLVFCGSTLGDSQLVQIHDEPIPVSEEDPHNDDLLSLELGETTYLSVVEEYTQLGPIVDFDLVPTTPGAPPSSTSTSNPSGTTGDGTNTSTGGSGTTPASAAAAAAAATAATSSNTTMVQSQVVTASGSSKSGSLRVIRNGIGMNEYASVELPGIQNMWSLRASFHDLQDAYLVQSFVGETRVLGVTTAAAAATGMEGMDEGTATEPSIATTDGNVDAAATTSSEPPPTPMEEEPESTNTNEEEEDIGGSLEEVVLPGLDSKSSTLYVSNVVGDLFLQITESQLRLASNTGELLDTWSPPKEDDDDDEDASRQSLITVASANEGGQIVIALRGGLVLYFYIKECKLVKIHSKQMDKEVSCLNLNPFRPKQDALSRPGDAMEVDTDPAAGSSSSDAAASVHYRGHTSSLVAVGLWDDFTVRLLSLEKDLQEVVQIHLSTQEDGEEHDEASMTQGQRRNRNNMMARSLCLITLDFSSSSSSASGNGNLGKSSAHHQRHKESAGVNMLFVGLGDGTLVSFAVVQSQEGGPFSVRSKKEVNLGTQRINLIPLHTERGGTCVLATGDRPTVIYLAGIGGASTAASSFNPKLCYSNVNLSAAEEDLIDTMNANDVSRPHAQQSIAVNVAAPFFSPLLFDSMGTEHYSLCVADDSNLRLGVIDDIQKLHVTTFRLGMAPRRIVHCPEGRLFAVGCIESGIKQVGLGADEANMGNCIRFLDDTSFDDIERIDLEPCEMVLSMVSATLRVFKPSSPGTSTGDVPGGVTGEIGTDGDSAVEYKPYLIIGTAYALHDEDEPTKGRILVLSCIPDGGHDAVSASGSSARAVRIVAELQVRGGVYSMCQFYDGKLLVTVNSKTQVCHIVSDGTGVVKLSIVGVGHHGHILSLFVKSRASKMIGSMNASEALVGDMVPELSSGNYKKQTSEQPEKDMLAIVGDLMRSISLVQYYPQHETLEEIARDFNANWTTAVEMLTDDVYLGGENWNNLFVLRRNAKATSEEIRCRLDTVGEFHLGEMCNKFMSGSLVMPHSTNSSATSNAPGAGRNLRRSLASPKKSNQDGGGGKSSSNASGAGTTTAMRSRRPAVVIGSQTLFGTVDGTLGSILGLDGPTAAFFSTLERCMEKVIPPVGNFSHQQFRAFSAEQRIHPSHGFVDGDLCESFLDLDRTTMELVVQQMNRDGGWEIDDSAFAMAGVAGEKEMDTSSGADAADDIRPELVVEDILAVVEEMAMLH